jgi:hypothetical protein
MSVKIINPVATRNIDSAALEEGCSIQNILDAFVPSNIHDSIEVHITGSVIPKDFWSLVKPKAGTTVEIYSPLSGGGENGGKNILAMILSIAVVAVGAFISAGGLGPILGAAFFGANTAGAAVLGAVVGIGGQLLIAALFPPKQATDTVEDSEKYADVDAGSNVLSPGASIPYVVGQYRMMPPMLAYPYYYLQNEIQVVEAIYGVVGPASFESLRLDSANIESFESVDYWIYEGWDAEEVPFELPPICRPQPLNITMDSFNLSGTALTSVAIPTEACPTWSRFTCKVADLDKIIIRLRFNGFIKSDEVDLDIRVPVRLRARKVGETTWRNFPEIHWKGRRQIVVNKEISIAWSTIPELVPALDTAVVVSNIYTQVPAATVTLVDGSSGIQWDADSTFVAGSGYQNYQNAIATNEGISFYVPSWDKGYYEFEIMSGLAVKDSNFSTSGYTISSKVYSLFTGYYNSSVPSVPKAQDGFQAGIVIVAVTGLKAQPCVNSLEGLAIVKIRSYDTSIDKFNCLIGNYVPDWDGLGWNDWKITKNPAPHFRYIPTSTLVATPLSEASIDDQNLIAWRAECISKGYEANMIAANETISSILDAIASAGFARVRPGSSWGVVYQHDTSSELPVQLFSPRNCESISWTLGFPKIPGSIITNYVDEDQEYTEQEIELDMPFSSDINYSESITYKGITKESAIRKRLLLDMLQMYHRRIVYQISTGLEHIVCEQGSIIGIATDIIQEYVTSGIIAKAWKDTNGQYIVIDGDLAFNNTDGWFETLDFFETPDIFDLGKATGMAILTDSGYKVFKVIGYSGGVYLLNSTELTTDVLNGMVGQHVILGVYGEEVIRAIVKSIEPREDLRGMITAVPEAIQIQEALDVA